VLDVRAMRRCSSHAASRSIFRQTLTDARMRLVFSAQNV